MKTLNIILAGLCLAGVISCKQAPVETCDKADAVIENIMAAAVSVNIRKVP